MDSTDEIDRLAEAERQLKEQHSAKKKELAALYKKERGLIHKKIRITQKRISASERKTDTRRKILIGAMVLSQVDQNRESKKLLLLDLDEFLERDRDRALFDLPPKDHEGGKIGK